MLSAFRRSLAQPALALRRGLATASVETPTILDPSVVALQQGSEASLINSILKDEAQSTLTTSPIVHPLFLTMSSLIRPKPTEVPPSEKVVELDPFIFSHPVRRDILHLCVVHYLDSIRQGSASTKTRGEVRGSGRKIRPQKGTGRARLGDGQSPMLRGGGIAFGPKPRDFSTKLPRKVIQMGMRAALSAKVKERGLGVVDNLEWPKMKTKDLAERLKELGWEKTLFVTGLKEVPEGLERASNNLHKIDTVTAEDLSVYHAVKWNRLILDVAAVEHFEHTLGKPQLPSGLSRLS